MELAREPGHHEGDHDVSYVIVVHLTPDGLIDSKSWKQYREACRVARLRPNEQDGHGHLVYHPGGAWGFRYDDEVHLPNEAGYHFADEHFVAGEYISINEAGRMHTYRVVTIDRL